MEKLSSYRLGILGLIALLCLAGGGLWLIAIIRSTHDSATSSKPAENRSISSAGDPDSSTASSTPGALPLPVIFEGTEWETWKERFFSHLESLPSSEAVSEVTQLMGHSRPEVRRLATDGAVFLEPETGVPLLAKALTDVDGEVRALARDYVSQQFDEDRILAYATALSHCSEPIAREILEDLNLDPSKQAVDSLLSDPSLAKTPHDALITDLLSAWLAPPEGVTIRSLADLRVFWQEHDVDYGPFLEHR